MIFLIAFIIYEIFMLCLTTKTAFDINKSSKDWNGNYFKEDIFKCVASGKNLQPMFTPRLIFKIFWVATLFPILIVYTIIKES